MDRGKKLHLPRKITVQKAIVAVGKSIEEKHGVASHQNERSTARSIIDGGTCERFASLSAEE
jgi:hypothetical protein